MQETQPKGIYQRWNDSIDVFFKRVDENGGWPLDKKYIHYYHSGDDIRPCEFGNCVLRTGWWTTIYSSDDYYKWKLSKEALDEIKKAAIVEFKARICGL